MDSQHARARCVPRLVLSSAVAVWCCVRIAPSHAEDFPASIPPLGANATLGAPPAQLQRGLLQASVERDWSPGVAAHGATRGAGQDLYPTVAPAVVVVRTPVGHGTGFLIDSDGWIITNHHVIDAAATDVATGAATVQVNLGRMNGRMMEVMPDAVPALVYKASAAQDLALLKLTRMPTGVTKLPALALSATPTMPGAPCVAIGHPAAGLLWTLRDCEVDGVGDWPSEHIDVRMWTLRATSEQDLRGIATLMSQIPKRRVVLSSCGINPGDSGGPLVNAKGEVIAVTFALPPEGLDHFAYHIDLEELKKFLAERPAQPAMRVPDPWPSAAAWELRDCDQDGKMETLLFGLANGVVMGLLCDLDEDSCPDAATVAAGHFTLDPEKWDFEFAVQPLPEHRTFYDRDNDGAIDLVRIDNERDRRQRVGFERRNGSWVRTADTGPLLDGALVPASTRTRYMKVVESLIGTAQTSR